MFASRSISWRLNREVAVLAGGTCALLMQIAHPAVAAGVAHHSDFRRDPFRRLQRTLGASWSIVFGDTARAERAIRRINAIHSVVHGVVPETGAPYRALDPDLLLWVHATLVDTALRVHDRFVAPLSVAEMDAYHREAARVAIRMGVPPDHIPETLGELRSWMADQMNSGAVRVGPTARALAPAILHPTRFPPAWVWDAAHLASISVMPPPLRQEYGISWNARRARGVERLGAVTRWAVPRLPDAVRFVPASRTPGRRASQL